jgi:hypothetical protein
VFQVVNELTAKDGLTHVVLDDIELPPDPRSLETPLAQIKSIGLSRRCAAFCSARQPVSNGWAGRRQIDAHR